MAVPTGEQEHMIGHLIDAYGKPDSCMIESTDEPQADVHLIWWNQQRRLAIKPDGTRQTFRTVDVY